jgi:uncharacterized membrane protein YhhN
MILIILIPILGSEGFPPLKILILVGLFFAMVGDIFLMLPGDFFLQALAAFFITHLSYSLGFLVDQGQPILWPILPVLSFSALVGWLLRDRLKEIKFPAFLYGLMISIMVWMAWSGWIQGYEINRLLAFCGAGLFMFSDLILSVSRFKVNFIAARGINLTAYYAGQWLIAISLINWG